MKIEELKQLFAERTRDKPLPVNGYFSADPKQKHPSNYMVYSFHALPFLIEKMKRYAITPDEEEREFQYQARYVVETDGSIWFALMGRSGDCIPKPTLQEQMSPGFQYTIEQSAAHSCINRHEVLASGDIIFSEDYQRIIRITNNSGHFLPPAETLAWPLAALLRLGAQFDETVTITSYRNKVDTSNPDVSVPRAELPGLVPAICPLVMDALVPRNEVRLFLDGSYHQSIFDATSAPCFPASVLTSNKKRHVDINSAPDFALPFGLLEKRLRGSSCMDDSGNELDACRSLSFGGSPHSLWSGNTTIERRRSRGLSSLSDSLPWSWSDDEKVDHQHNKSSNSVSFSTTLSSTVPSLDPDFGEETYLSPPSSPRRG